MYFILILTCFIFSYFHGLRFAKRAKRTAVYYFARQWLSYALLRRYDRIGYAQQPCHKNILAVLFVFGKTTPLDYETSIGAYLRDSRVYLRGDCTVDGRLSSTGFLSKIVFFVPSRRISVRLAPRLFFFIGSSRGRAVGDVSRQTVAKLTVDTDRIDRKKPTKWPATLGCGPGWPDKILRNPAPQN